MSGAKQGKPLLILLHGWGLNRGVWHSLLPLLTDKFRVRALDLPGFGAAADDLPAFSAQLPLGEQVLEAMVERLATQVDEPAIWLGWSLGGMVALRLAARYPDKVVRLMMVVASPSFVTRDDWPHAMPVATLETFSAELERDQAATLNRFLALQVRGSENAKPQLQELKSALAAGGEASVQALRAGLAILREVDLRADLRQIKLPLGFIFGERDKLVPEAALPEIVALSPDCQQTIFTAVGHAPFLAQPHRFVKCVRSFVGE